jgi:predicted N-acetyltransferase YhbS
MEPVIRSLRESDLQEADKIFRLSFGTFLGLPDPMSFFGDPDYVITRFRADPSLSLAAEVDAKLVGSNFIANWGIVGIFGPLTVHPDLWEKGIAKRLLDKTMEIFEKMKTKHIGIFTFSHSPKHIHLYQKYDFW